MLSKYMETRFYEDIGESPSLEREREVSRFGGEEGCNWTVSLCVAVAVFGTFGTVAASYVNVVSAVNSLTFSPPCISYLTNVTERI